MHRIPLENGAFEGRNNAYLLEEGSETVLVDTGDDRPETRSQLEKELADRGVDVSDIDRILLTHWHGDHSGLAGVLQRESGASVHAHAEDAPLVRRDEDAYERMYELQRERFAEWGIPPEKEETLRSYQTLPDGPRPTVEPFEHGDTFELGDLTLRVEHASGHAAGLSCFVVQETREVFSGDALLPVYTPNVGGADVRVDRPLERYLEMMVRFVREDFARAWPGHRDPIADPAARATDIIDHHETRSWRVLDVLDRRGASDPWAVSAELFGELDGIHIKHGPGEAFAHLDHLARTGTVDRAGRTYRLASGVDKRLEARTDERWPLVERDDEGRPVRLGADA